MKFILTLEINGHNINEWVYIRECLQYLAEAHRYDNSPKLWDGGTLEHDDTPVGSWRIEP